MILLCLSNYQWKNIIYQLRKQFYEINQKLKLGHLFQLLSVHVLLQPIYTSELSELLTLLQSLGPKKYKGKGKENQKYPIIVFFTVCLNATFTNNWQNLRTQQCSSKAMNDNMSWIYQMEIYFLTRKIVCKPQKATLHKKKSFPLRISSVNVTKSAVPTDLLTFTEEILIRKLHFMCSAIFSSEDSCEVQRFTDQQNSSHRYKQNFSNSFQGYIRIFEINIV